MTTIKITSGLPAFSEQAQRSRYLMLVSYDDDGSPVATPVCFVTHGKRLLIWTSLDSGKVRRIMASGRVAICTCERTGRPTSLPAAATAAVLDHQQAKGLEVLLDDKYGWRKRLFTAYRAIIKRFTRASPGALACISITPDQ